MEHRLLGRGRIGDGAVPRVELLLEHGGSLGWVD
jgi:hypothetical protein